MARRSTSRFQLDNRAFPIRVLVRNLTGDALALRLTAAQAWLNENVGRGEWAMHGQSRIGLHAIGFYFRRLEAAEAFLNAHRHLELEDTTGQLQHVVAARRAASGTPGPL
jgi:hypothetical protein